MWDSSSTTGTNTLTTGTSARPVAAHSASTTATASTSAWALSKRSSSVTPGHYGHLPEYCIEKTAPPQLGTDTHKPIATWNLFYILRHQSKEAYHSAQFFHNTLFRAENRLQL